MPFLNIPEIEQKVFGLWSMNFQGLSKLYLTCPNDDFVEKFIVKRYCFFAH